MDSSTLVIITGTVLEGPSPNVPISGASVSVETVGRACTSIAACPIASTNHSGGFILTRVEPGTIIVTVQVGANMTNETTLFNVSAGATVSTGIIYMVPDAIVSGCVKGDDPEHEPAADIQVAGYSRDGRLEALSPVTTNTNNGCFNTPGVPVPPGPAVIDFTPEAGASGFYEANDTYVDLYPGEHYSLPYTVYLTVGVRVLAIPYDSVTKQPLPTGTCYPYATSGQCVSIQFENRLTGVAFTQGTVQSEGTNCLEDVTFGCPTAIAPPGNDTITILADGYLQNASPIYIPAESPGQTVDLGPVWLVPDGAVNGTNGFTWPTSVQASPWYDSVAGGAAMYILTVCSLDGYLPAFEVRGGLEYFDPEPNMTSNSCLTSCQYAGSPFAALAPPLRVSVHIQPDTEGQCTFPPSWPIPDALPVYVNATYANVTPDEYTSVGELDWTAGTYVTGLVEPGYSWTVTACSTDETKVCFPSSAPINTTGGTYNGATGGTNPCTPSEQGNWAFCPDDPVGCPNPDAAHAGNTFCVAVFPGPDELFVSSPGGGTNVTWLDVPPGVFTGAPLALSAVTTNHVSSINLSSGFITGNVTDRLSGLLIPNWLSPLASATPAGLGTGGGSSGVVGGKFNITSTPGWLAITAVAGDYVPNVTWVHANDSPVATQAGNLSLDPVSWLAGQVFDVNGTPLRYATVETCEIGGGSCQPVFNGGDTNTFGQYGQELAAGPLPLGTYVVSASAPGYVANNTWVNVTEPGQYYNASPINLTPFLEVHLGSDYAPSAGGLPPPRDPDEYLVGQLVDNETGEGIPTATISLNSVYGGTILLQGSITDGGAFNYTVATGQYWANFTAQNYYPLSVYLNVSGLVPQLQLGVLHLVPFVGYVVGQVDIAPWSSLTTASGLGPGKVSLTICLEFAPTVCGQGLADSSGFFNVSAPWGYHDSVLLQPTGNVPAGLGSAPYGFLNSSSNANVINGSNRTFVHASLDIFGGITGIALDQSTQNRTPVRFGSIGVDVSNRTNGQAAAAEQIGGGGAFTLFVPPGTVAGELTGSAYVPWNFTSPQDLGNVTPGNVETMAAATLAHFGWIVGNLSSSVIPYRQGDDWVPGAGVSTMYYDLALGGNVGGDGVSDGVGYFNVTAPPFDGVTLQSTAPDYNTTFAFEVEVNQSETTHVGPRALPPMVPWGWVSGTVADPTIGVPIDSASVLVTDPTGIFQSNTGLVTSESGQFMADGIPGPSDQMVVGHDAYLTNTTTVAISAGNLTALGAVELTGTGVVAGQVIGYPGGQPLGGAAISVCSTHSPACSNFTTQANQEGVFWALAPPGADLVEASFAGYTSNASILVQVPSDSWEWIGSVGLAAYATVTGTVLAVPSGLSLPETNVSFCSPLVVPGEVTGPCFSTVQTNSIGQFSISARAGTYILELNESGYASTYLQLSLSAGEQVQLGSVLLLQDGTLTGEVVGSDTSAPVPGALVDACTSGNFPVCTPTVQTNSEGTFRFQASPGSYVVLVTAPSYQDLYLHVQAQTGFTTSLGVVELEPIGSNVLYSVSGSVVAAESSTPISGASVISVGGYVSSPTDLSGGFSLEVPWGTYQFVAREAGYESQVENVTVHQDVSGLLFDLSPTAYSFSGIVRDGLTNSVVAEAEIEAGGPNGSTVLATSATNGFFSA
ncbi:MAG: carboxypeptidase regulatory-like domain-containing protein, partial [Thermoplasmata archaeon]|nr:carboxypeptidase regulatory-like domain-containing protein [Thermoplasmata archaeon]